jgi:prevent-host-death family protein
MSGETKKIREVPISEFKAKCFSLSDEVSKTKASIRITHRGKVIAYVVPVPPNTKRRDWIGSLAGTVKIVGDIVAPVIQLKDSEAMK